MNRWEQIKHYFFGHNFYIGQRVKIIACDSPPDIWMVGQEGFVHDLCCENDEGLNGHVGITVHGCSDWCFWPWELKPAEDDPPKKAIKRKEEEIA